MAPAQHPARAALSALKSRVVWSALGTLPDRQSVALQYWRAHHRFPDLDAPRRFTEKLQWLKLYGDLEAHACWVD